MPRRLNLPPATVNAFRRALVRWYHRHKRDLPWRGTRDPYRIWVSEIMLQQTRVETVRDYYRRWLAEFPTLAALAAAPVERVLKMWEGLGYYSRARNLHRAAQRVNAVPATVAELRQLPGIGRYTAGAIASIAFAQRAPLVDGNVARIFARVFARHDRFWELAEALLPATNCGDYNQALMELGALVCRPVNPQCARCPLRAVCVAAQRGWQTRLPRRRARRPVRQVTEDRLFIERAGKILLRQRPPTGELAGLWELPAGKSDRLLWTLRHGIMDRQITLRVFRGTRAAGQWFTRRQAARLAMPAAQRRALTAVTRPARRSSATGAQKHR
jgi:A/G-specific adenine glycosylase